jgi:hypothetical protein
MAIDTEDNKAHYFDAHSALLVLAVVVFYFIFQLILIFTSVVGLHDECLYSFWTPNLNWWENPYWIVVGIVCGLLCLAVYSLIDGITQKNTTRMVVGFSASTVLVLWLYGMAGLWNAMLFEKGEVSIEKWYEPHLVELILFRRQYDFENKQQKCNHGI